MASKFIIAEYYESHRKMRSTRLLLALSSLFVFVTSLGGIGVLEALDERISLVASVHRHELPIDIGTEGQTIPIDDTMILYGSLAMLFWCIVGALIGAWTYVFIIPDTNTNPRRMAAKLVSAAGCGITFTPLVIHVGGLPRDPNLIGGIATIVAIVSVGVIVDILPLVTARLKSWLIGRIPEAPNDRKS